jgi:hypothetical protein
VTNYISSPLGAFEGIFFCTFGLRGRRACGEIFTPNKHNFLHYLAKNMSLISSQKFHHFSAATDKVVRNDR